MPRACIIVLDAVGAGELPDADEYGDAGSNTLANVADAVGGLDLPNLEALGLGNIEPLQGCPPQPGAPAVAGRLIERSKGKDTTTGHWELMGVVTPQPMPTYPHGFPHDVIDPFMHQTGRGVLGNKPASGTEIIQELGEEHQRTGKWIVYTSADSVFQIAAHEETIPLEELYDGCRIARQILTGKHAVGRVIARPFVGEPGNYERTPGRHDYSLEPRRPNYLSLLRDAGVTVHGVGKIHVTFAGPDIDESHPTKSNVDGITQTEKLLRELDDGLIFTNLVETDMLWGHRNDPENFHRCLQDFDRRLPDLLDALRPQDLLILTSDHGCDPTTPSTDHSREHAMLLAYVEGKNAAGRIHEGEFADVGATVNAWLGGKSPSRGLGHTGGTLDKLESIPGFRIELTVEEFIDQVREVGLAIIGQTADLVPADKLLYGLRDVTATVDNVSLIAASIMSKKIAAGADAIVLDVKVGDGAFMKTIDDARELAGMMLELGRHAGREVACMLTDMDQPLGQAVGNALEIREAIATLRGEGPADFTELVLTASAHLLAVSDLGIDHAEARRRAEQAIADGSAVAHYERWVAAQGG